MHVCVRLVNAGVRLCAFVCVHVSARTLCKWVRACAPCGSFERGASSEPQCVLFSRVPGLKCNFIQSRKLGFLLY